MALKAHPLNIYCVKYVPSLLGAASNLLHALSFAAIFCLSQYTHTSTLHPLKQGKTVHKQLYSRPHVIATLCPQVCAHSGTFFPCEIICDSTLYIEPVNLTFKIWKIWFFKAAPERGHLFHATDVEGCAFNANKNIKKNKIKMWIKWTGNQVTDLKGWVAWLVVGESV